MNLKLRHRELCKSEGREIELRQAIRINTLKISEKDCVKRLREKDVTLKKIDFLKTGYFADAEFTLASMPEYLQGYFYIQEAASQLPAEILNPREKDTVIDMCASPGSKTTHIAQQMNNKGVLIALDLGARINKLKNNLQRLGIKNCIVYNQDARFFEYKADKILLDAPCSGNYTVEDNWYEKRNIDDIKSCARTQKELLSKAIKNLKPGGILVYSTCSLEPEENEFVVDWALSRFDVKLEKIKIGVGDRGITKFKNENIELSEELKKTVRLWPSKTGTQGFYIAKLRKLGEKNEKYPK